MGSVRVRETYKPSVLHSKSNAGWRRSSVPRGRERREVARLNLLLGPRTMVMVKSGQSTRMHGLSVGQVTSYVVWSAPCRLRRRRKCQRAARASAGRDRPEATYCGNRRAHVASPVIDISKSDVRKRLYVFLMSISVYRFVGAHAAVKERKRAYHNRVREYQMENTQVGENRQSAQELHFIRTRSDVRSCAGLLARDERGCRTEIIATRSRKPRHLKAAHDSCQVGDPFNFRAMEGRLVCGQERAKSASWGGAERAPQSHLGRGWL